MPLKIQQQQKSKFALTFDFNAIVHNINLQEEERQEEEMKS